MRAAIVIIGSGIVGSSIAYHLAGHGVTDIVVVDQGPVVENAGSTSHAPGGVVALSHNRTLTQLAQYACDLYLGLDDYSPERKMVHPHGLLDVAVSERRWIDLRREHGEGKSFGVDTELLGPDEVHERHRLVDPAAIEGAIFVPSAMAVVSSHLNGALQRAAGDAVTFLGHTRVVDVEVHHGHVTAVVTANPEVPRIECDMAVLATNIWAPVIGDKLGIPIPLLAYEHQYLVSGPVPELAGFDPGEPAHEQTFPLLRDLDSAMYFRQHWRSIGIGSYRHPPRRVRPAEVGAGALRDVTLADFLGEPFERAQTLVPALRGTDPAGYPTAFNGMFAFSVDGMPIIGESDTGGLWVACASWLTHAGGVGKMTADWMMTGDTEWDPRQVNLHRFHGFHSTPAYVERICDTNYVEVYEIVHPRRPTTAVRDVRLSPFDERHRRLGAELTVFAGIELPNWYEANAGLLEDFGASIPSRRGWEAEHWSPIQGAEHLATRRSVGLFDLHGLSIVEVSGPEAGGFAEHLCANRVARGVGRVVYTTWLTPDGGVKRDLAVVRMAEDRFWFFVGEGTRPQDVRWAELVATGRVGGRRFDVAVSDISDSWSALGIWGPQARQVLQRLTSTDLSHEAFGYFTARWIDVGTARVLALRVSYAGELGWEIHMPVDAAVPVWDAVWEAGRDHRMVAVGQGAFDSLRLEKGYRAWGTDVDTEHDAYAAGLGWTVRLDKGEFVGSAASAALAERTPPTRLVCLRMEDRGAVALGYEPILAGDRPVGYVTSANFGYSVGAFLAYGYVPVEHSTEGTRLDIEYFGRRFAAVVASDPQFDPKMTRMLA